MKPRWETNMANKKKPLGLALQILRGALVNWQENPSSLNKTRLTQAYWSWNISASYFRKTKNISNVMDLIKETLYKLGEREKCNIPKMFGEYYGS